MDDTQLVDVMTQESLKRCFKKWGVEKTEEKIFELCKIEAMRECLLRNYYKLLKG
jgi:hypothetical protein